MTAATATMRFTAADRTAAIRFAWSDPCLCSWCYTGEELRDGLQQMLDAIGDGTVATFQDALAIAKRELHWCRTQRLQREATS